MTSGLGQFVRTPKVNTSDQFKAKDNQGKPLLVWVREIKWVKTKYWKQKSESDRDPRGAEGVVVDLFSVNDNAAFINVLWMAGAVKDGLLPYVGSDQPLPVKIMMQEGGDYEGYLVVEALEGAELQAASAFYTSYPTYVNDTRVQRLAAWKAAAEAEQAASSAPAPAGPPPGVPTLAPIAGPAPTLASAPAVPPAPANAPFTQPPAAPAAPPAPAAEVPAAAAGYAAPGYVAPTAAPGAPAAAPPAVAAPVTPPAVAAPGGLTGETVEQLRARLAAMEAPAPQA